MSQKSMTTAELVKEKFQPVNQPLKKGESSGRKPLEAIFNKTKTYIDAKKSKEIVVPVDWVTFNMSGNTIHLIKGEVVSKRVIELFGDAADRYFSKKKSGGKAEEEAAIEAAIEAEIAEEEDSAE